jgi:diguanylate cyclase (GGDEF)-like protein
MRHKRATAEFVTDTSLLDSIDLSTIDRAIASEARRLTFSPRLEAIFESETGPQRRRELISRAYVGIAVYDLFAFADWWATPKLLSTFLFVRLVVFTPLALLMTSTLYLSPSALIRESVMCVGGGLLSIATIIYLMAVSGDSLQATLHQSIVLVVLFMTVVQRIRFWHLIPTCLAFLAVHAFALATFYKYAIGEQVATDMVFGGTVIFALVAAYTMERDLRLHYLLSLRGRVQNQELDMMSRRDPLTGLGNRRSLEESLAACERDADLLDELSVVLIDIDHFKLFNDTAGHQAGDVCLKRIATVIQSEAGDHADHAFRFGGEEFIVVLRATDLSSGIRAAERMRRAIEEAAIPHPALSVGSVVTASFGVACARPTEEARAADIVASADTALYAAKRNGRNQVWPPFLSASCAETGRALRR